MKNCMRILTLALVAAGAVTAVEGQEAKSGPAVEAKKAELKTKFDTPMWSSEARWKRERWEGSEMGVFGNLDGSRLQTLHRRYYPIVPYVQEGGPYHLTGYDSVNEHVMDISGGGRGLLDGPLSRARFGGSGYSMGGGASGLTPDGRFFVMGDGINKATRLIDLKEQTVRSVPELAAMKFFDSMGNAWLYKAGKDGNKLVSVDVATLKTNREIVLKEGIPVTSECLLDEVHDRIYLCGDFIKRDGTNWFVSYLDMKDGGTFHGVLSGGILGPHIGYTGPFDGYSGYPNGHIQFAPGDTQRRYLIHHATDTGNFRCMDVEKRMITQFDCDPKTGEGRLIDTKPGRQDWAHQKPMFLEDGSFIVGGGRQSPTMIYRRVK